MVLCFAKALGEFGATITFVSNIPGETQTISSAVYALIQTPAGDREAAQLIVVSIILAFGALLVYVRNSVDNRAGGIHQLRAEERPDHT